MLQLFSKIYVFKSRVRRRPALAKDYPERQCIWEKRDSLKLLMGSHQLPTYLPDGQSTRPPKAGRASKKSKPQPEVFFSLIGAEQKSRDRALAAGDAPQP